MYAQRWYSCLDLFAIPGPKIAKFPSALGRGLTAQSCQITPVGEFIEGRTCVSGEINNV
jgi:hypothetical protein